MTKPTQPTLLTRDLLDERHYLPSLLSSASVLGLIDESFLPSFQRSFTGLLSRQCRAFAGGHSRSMRAEAAESIGESILFTMSAHLSRFEPLDALAQLQNRSLEECFIAGRARVDALVKSAELTYMAELRRPLPVPNELLRSTLEGGLSSFFRVYNPEYGAQEIHITADYPVLFFPQGFQGIEFIRRYLDGMVLENRFLRLFSPEILRSLLSAYAAKSGFTLGELHGNLFEIALALSLKKHDSPEALLDDLGCASPSLRAYVLRACRNCALSLAGIQRFMGEYFYY